jgi:beta-lactamase class A
MTATVLNGLFTFFDYSVGSLLTHNASLLGQDIKDMQHSPARRSLLIAMLAVPAMSACSSFFAGTTKKQQTLLQKLAALETSAKGRLGLCLGRIDGEVVVNYRAGERFALCSTFKVLIAAAALQHSVTDSTFLQKHIYYGLKDVSTSGYAPITEKYLSQGMSISELCAATIQYSDNAAANLLMRELGGPQGITDFARSLGDETFRLDRWEPDLNSALPQDERDTSTPLAIAKTLNKLVLGDALGISQREQLTTWLQGNTTGDKRIRAALPKNWTVGDKTGTGSYGTTNDVAVIWPPQGAPFVLAIYFTQTEKSAAPRDDVIAIATQIVLEALH